MVGCEGYTFDLLSKRSANQACTADAVKSGAPSTLEIVRRPLLSMSLSPLLVLVPYVCDAAP